jgi:Restriction endonuclease
VLLGEKSKEGQLVTGVTVPRFEIIALMQKHPDVIDQIGWRKWEEIVAGGWDQLGFEAALTPRSGDKGRDVYRDIVSRREDPHF